MGTLRFRKGTWTTDKTKVAVFISRLEKCLLDVSMEGSEGLISLLNEVKKAQMYDHNALHTLEDVEYQIMTKNDSPDGLVF
jgi:hypothetical protein